MDGDSLESDRDSRRQGTKTLTLSQSLSKENCVSEIKGVLVPMDLDSAWPMEHLIMSLSRAEVLIECLQLLEEHPPDLVQSFLWAIISMILVGALVGWFRLGKLFARRGNVETKDCAIILPIKSIRCGQSVGGGTVLSRQFKHFAARLMMCFTP